MEYLRDKFWKADWLEIIRTNNPVMRQVFEHVRSVAPTIATVLLQGETGTGKGLMASLIRKDRLEDLPHLVELFLTNLNAKYGKAIKGVHPRQCCCLSLCLPAGALTAKG